MGLCLTHSNRQIEATLASQGIKVSRTTIGKFIKETERERGVPTKEAASEYIKKTVMADLKMLEDMRDQLNAWRLGRDDNGKPIKLRVTEKLMVIDRLNRVIAMRLDRCGVNEDDEETAMDFNLFDKEERRRLLDEYINGRSGADD